MEVATTVIATNEEEEEADYEEYEEEDDAGPLTGSDLFYQSDVPIAGVTYNPNRPTRPLTELERKIQLGGMALEYGVPKDKTVKVRFVVGVRERKRAPGKAPEVDRFRRSWYKLKDFMRDHNWRRILSNHFEGDYQDEPMPFKVDNYRWKTVVHFMLGMLYAGSPGFAVLFSLNSEENENAYWGTVKAAVKAHLANINGGPYQPDPNFGNKVEGYLQQAMMAKFTQNPVAREALLLTEDAVITIRGGPDGMLDVPIYAIVRQFLKDNPTSIYNGPNAPTTFTKEEIPYLRSNEQLNHGFVDKVALQEDQNEDEETVDLEDLIGGSITRQQVYVSRSIRTLMTEVAAITGNTGYIETEALLDCTQIVYLITGTYDFSIVALIERYGQPRFVRRHIYGLEKIADNLQEQLMIGIQRQPSSLISEYLAFDVEIPGTFPIRITIYLEPFEEGLALFLVTDDKKQEVLDFLRALRGAALFREPRGLGDLKEDILGDLPLGTKRVKTTPLTYEDVYWRLKAINSFLVHYTNQLDFTETDEQVKAISKLNFLTLVDQLLVRLADFNGEDLFNEADANEDAASNLEGLLRDFREQLATAQIKLDGREVTENLLKLVADSKASSQKSGVHAPRYQRDSTTNKEIILDRDFRFELETDRFRRLTKFMKSEMTASIQTARMLMAYETINLGGSTGSLMMPADFYRCLHQIYPISLDGFSSPLGSLIPPEDIPFASVFDDIDKDFGSLGNVFRLNFAAFVKGQVEVNVVLNVPSYQYIVDDTLLMIDRWFKDASEAGVALRLFVIFPKAAKGVLEWVDKHQYLRLKVDLLADQYVQQGSKNQKLVTMKTDSLLVVLDSSSVGFRAESFNACLDTLKPIGAQ